MLNFQTPNIKKARSRNIKIKSIKKIIMIISKLIYRTIKTNKMISEIKNETKIVVNKEKNGQVRLRRSYSS